MNLDIEGTKHEKVVLVVLSYVIGFTAGFICFGVAQSFRHDNREEGLVSQVAFEVVPAVPVNPTPNPSADQSNLATNGTVVDAVTDSSTGVTYTDGKLQVHKNGDTYLLSMKSSHLSASVQSSFKNQGMHLDVPVYSLSPDNKYVYFCEQQTTEDSCNSFVFDIEKNVIEYVTVDGKKFSSPAAVAKTATWSEKGLTIEGKSSADATAPAALLAS